MSYLHVQQLVVMAEDYLAVRQAIARSLQETSLPGYAVLNRAEGSLETAYIVRLFSEFKGSLRSYLKSNDPRHRPVPRSVFSVINRAALQRIPNSIRDDVHEAREYRNSVVHSDGTTRAAIPFSTARSILSKFAARLS
ncbi:MAG: hypothetical protein ACRYFS_23620 [Janthinobacterium lividum]